jgi:cell division septum initiation protein DivIVA
VKGKNVDGYVFVENDGTLSVVGWDALKQRVDDIEEDVSDLQDDVVELQEKVEEIEEQLEGDTEKLDTIEEGAQKNVQSDFNETEEDSDAFIKNKPIQYKIKNATRIPTGSSFTITDTDIKATSTIIL